MSRIPVTVLGATGVVGQRFVRRLAGHPMFEVTRIAASDRSAGKPYRDACEWRLDGEPYAGLGDRVLLPSDPREAMNPIVFSALDNGRRPGDRARLRPGRRPWCSATPPPSAWTRTCPCWCPK